MSRADGAEGLDAPIGATAPALRLGPFNVDDIGWKLLDPAATPTVTVTCTADPTPGGEGCIGVQVNVVDHYRGRLFTQALPGYDISGDAAADLVVAQ